MSDYTRLSSQRRRRMLERALAEHGRVCCICGLTIAEGDESLQHIRPRSKGGTDDPSNLAPAHRSCNYAAGDREQAGPAGEVHNGMAYFVRPLVPDERR